VLWVPPEVADPVLLHAPTRKSVAVFGAVRPQDGHLVVNQASCFNTDSFQSFLQHLLRHRRKRRLQLVILDNAAYHHARALHPWLHQQRALLRLDFLPTASPKLNHQERVWKLTRRVVTHNRYFPLLDELQQAVLGQFALWDKPNETLRRLCAII
jgi:transposase